MTIESQNIMMNCIHHPQTLTGLRCNRCGQLVCARCVVRTPVGYRCKMCVKGQQKVFETLRISDYLVTPVVVMTLAGMGSLFSVISPWLTVLATPVAVRFMTEIVRRVIERRWSRHLRSVVMAAFVIGCLPMACSLLTSLTDLWSIAGLLLYIGIGINTLRTDLRGIVF